jgi:phage terminase large subunit
VFEGQFFPEFDPSVHVCQSSAVPQKIRFFASFDYGLDMLAALLIGVDTDGIFYVLREYCESGLTLSEAAKKISKLCDGYSVEYAVASPDLWNRRQDSGKSGFEIMQESSDMPPMVRADNRRVAGWRVLREYLNCKNGQTKLNICCNCTELIHSLSSLLCDPHRAEDASDEPHSITHAPEALRYAVMSRTEHFENSLYEDFDIYSKFSANKKSSSFLFD